MGLLTSLIEMKSQKDTKAKTDMANALGLILKDDNANPGQKEWALNSIVQLADGEFGGGKGKGKSGGGGLNAAASPSGGHPEGVGGFFKAILGHAVQGVKAGADTLNPTTPSRKTKAGLQEIAGSRPSGPIEMTDEQQQQRAAKIAEAQAAEQNKLNLQKDQTEWDFYFKKGQEANLTGRDLAEFAGSRGQKLPTTPAVKPPTRTQTQLIGPDGKEFTGYRGLDAEGKEQIYKLGSDTPLDPNQYKVKADKADTGQMAQYEAAMRAQHPDWDEGKVRRAASDQFLKDQKLKDQRIQVSIAGAQQNQQEKADQNRPADPQTTRYWSEFLVRGGQITYGMWRGMSQKQVREITTAIPQVARELGMSVGEVIAQQADKQGLTSALGQMEKQYATTSAFEATAKANLDRAINAAKKVTDTGIPIINKPWRMVEKELFGKPEYGAYHAARITAFTEVSKVLNNPNGQGAISDSARKEGEEAVGGDGATLGQLQAAAELLRQDMETRVGSMRETIQATRQHIATGTAGGSETPTPAATATPTTTPNAGGAGAGAGDQETRDYNGHTYARKKGSNDNWKLVK